jgi:hypothetical protein
VRIDRPAEDDTPRARPDSHAADTSPEARHEPPDRVACAVGYRATVDTAYHDYQAAREWDEAVPALREAWETHEKKWIYPERTEPTVHPEVPGAWRGPGGRYLAPDANAEVTHGCARIREVGETVITPALRRIEAEDPDRHLAGLDHYLKGEDRLKEKVAERLQLRPELSPSQVLSAVPDAVRFTFLYPEASYADGVRADLVRLRTERFELTEPLKNSWTDGQYKGINSRWREPESGQIFELQFHTRASFEAKQLTHPAYERIRNPETSDDERAELEAFQGQACDKIPIPLGAAQIGDYLRKDHDGSRGYLLRDR